MVQQKVCDKCPNVKMELQYSELDIEIESGMAQGQTMVFAREGEPEIDGEPGDLRLTINMEPHDRFWRIGNDLYTNVTISLEDALLGFETEIEHLDKHKTTVKRDVVTSPGTVVQIPQEGMVSYENNHVKGDMFVTFDVEFPDGKLPASAKEPLVKVLQDFWVGPNTYRGM